MPYHFNGTRHGVNHLHELFMNLSAKETWERSVAFTQRSDRLEANTGKIGYIRG